MFVYQVSGLTVWVSTLRLGGWSYDSVLLLVVVAFFCVFSPLPLSVSSFSAGHECGRGCGWLLLQLLTGCTCFHSAPLLSQIIPSRLVVPAVIFDRLLTSLLLQVSLPQDLPVFSPCLQVLPVSSFLPVSVWVPASSLPLLLALFFCVFHVINLLFI